MEFLTVTDPLDWPSTMPELKTIDTLLRCSICYEFYDIAMMIPQCSHNYCSVCIRRYLTYKNQCPTCNTPAEASQLCGNRALDDLVANFKAVRPQILKLCKEDAKQKGEGTPMISPQSKLAGEKKKGKKKASPFRAQMSSDKTNTDSDGDFRPDHHAGSKMETPKRKLQKRSSYKDTREKIASHAAELSSDSVEEVKQDKKADSHHHVPPTDPSSSSSTSSSASSPPPPPTTLTALNRSNEENIDPTYEPMNRDDGGSDDDGVPMATPSKPSTSHGQADSDRDTTPATRSEKVDCPVCGVPISSKHINTHLDGCLTRSEEKEKRKRVVKRKPLPKMVLTLLKEKELRKKLKDFGLNTQGQRQVLIKRLNDFTLMYNAQCDSPNPISVEALVREFNRVEKLKTQPTNPNLPDQRLKVSRSQSEDQINKGQQDYLKTHNSHFQDLIKNVKQRMKEKKPEKAISEEGAEKNQRSDGESASAASCSSSQSSTSQADNASVGGPSISIETASAIIGMTGSDAPSHTVARTKDVCQPDNGKAAAAAPDGTINDGPISVIEDEAGHESDPAKNQVLAVKQRAKGSRLRLSNKKSHSDPAQTPHEREQHTPSSSDVDKNSSEQSRTLVDNRVLNDERLVVEEESVPLAMRLDSTHSEEQMDLTEDDRSPVFGRCSGGSTRTTGSNKDAELVVKLDLEGQRSPDMGDSSVLVPPPPNLLLLDEVDRISEGSSLATLDTLSEMSEGRADVPSPTEVTCIPESPGPGSSRDASKPKKLGRRKRKPEVSADDSDGSGEARLTRSRKRGKTSTT